MGLPIWEINLDIFPHRRSEMFDRTNKKTLPQIFFNDKHIGGNEELQNILNSTGDREQLLNYIIKTPPNEDCPNLPPVEIPNSKGNYSGEIDWDFLCETDKHIELVKRIHSSTLVRNLTYHFKTFKKCFIGKELVNWLIENGEADSRERAIQIGNELLDLHYFHHVTQDHNFKDKHLFYRFIEDEPVFALNGSELNSCRARSATEVGEELRRLLLDLYSEFLSKDGKYVDYSGIKSSESYKTYVYKTWELQRLDMSDLTREEKLAFWINIYNSLVIHATVEVGRPKTNWQRLKFFSTNVYMIGGSIYSLNDIEHGVLRANTKPPLHLRKPFSKTDPRKRLCLESVDPRIHFSLVCGAKSCPPIRIFRSKDIDNDLKLATESFLEGGGIRVIKPRELSLTKLLRWYGSDFGSNQTEMLRWICPFCPNDIRSLLEVWLDEVNPNNQQTQIKIQWQDYDWSQNGK